MNQEKIGKFILELRKQKGLTQKELAEKIGVSDKTISKWECGNSIPDISYLEALCNSLDISVNELLSGERLSQESYSEKAEENIMALMKENEINKKGNLTRIIFGSIFAIMPFGIAMLCSGGGMSMWMNYYDFPSILMLGLLYIAIVLLSGCKTKLQILSCLQKTAIPNGVLIMLFEFVILMSILSEPDAIGPNLAVCILTLLYSVIVYLAVTILKIRYEEE